MTYYHYKSADSDRAYEGTEIDEEQYQRGIVSWVMWGTKLGQWEFRDRQGVQTTVIADYAVFVPAVDDYDANHGYDYELVSGVRSFFVVEHSA